MRFFNKTTSLLLLGAYLFLSLSNLALAEDDKTLNILILNSYHKGFHWVDGIVEAVESGLNAENYNFQLRVEYMDTKVTQYTTAYKKKLYELYSLKYHDSKFDAIIASDDDAFDFLREYHKELFNETPIVFCAVNNTNAAHLIDRHYFTGVLETPDQEAMINLALKLHPETKQIYVIADTTRSGNYRWEKQTVPLIAIYPNIKFIRIDDSLSFQEVEDKLTNLQDNAISFYAVLSRDRTGRHFPLREAVSRISKASRTPIYTFLSQDLRYGLIGGNVLDGYHQGEMAVDMIIRIIQGENIATIPIEENPTSQFMFSYPQLKRFNINVFDLPKDSIIIHKPDSFYSQNKLTVWITVGILAFLLTLVVIFAFIIIHNRKTKREQWEREEKLQLLFNNSPVGICTVDLLGNFITTNPAYEKMLGYTKEELSTFSFYDVTHPDYRPKNKELFQNMFSLQKNSFKMEKIYIRKDGDMIHVSLNATAVIDDTGSTRFGTAFVEDITEQKKVVEALAESEQLLSEAQRLASIGSWVQDERSNTLTWSDETFRIFEINKDFSGTLYSQFVKAIHPDDRKIVTTSYQESLVTKTPYKITHRLQMPDGRIKYVHECCETEYAENGTPVRSIGTVQDITGRIKAEEKQEELKAQLSQSQKLESVGRLAGGVAHDFNNMLSIIIGYAEMSLEMVHPDDQIHEYITDILDAGERSANITRQLLAFARQQTTAPKVLDLNDNIAGLLKMLQRLIGEDIDLVWQPDNNVWKVKIDPSQIDQILANLCVNARDAIADVGQITIETDNVIFDKEYCAVHSGFIPGEYVMLTVSDNGCGIAPEYIDKVFEPFFTSKDLHEGTGLGLSTVFGIVKQNNGFINIYSELEFGTTIKIYFLKYSGKSDAKQLKRTQDMPLGNGEAILLVEDDRAILKLGEKMLTSLGYTVRATASPAKAISLVEDNLEKFELLITDVVMPEMNGRKLSQTIQSKHPGIKTLYMSGYTANVIANRGVLEDGVHFIPKPLDKKELSVKVREALDNGNA